MARSWQSLVYSLAAAGLVLFAGCDRKVQNAIVTGKDFTPEIAATKERQSIPEVWTVHVEMENGKRRTDAYVTKEKWESLKAGDRVRIRYLEGEYSHAIWSADLEKL